ncbi:putative hsp70 family chaperone protein [Daldinia childiae]|uniref:putative hsp70 family chaperone protein n=1 Tax=Daldinia childiae TaxID=326645 RepID=UPI001444E67B|nr:putative hsp70 family chaperone protein [Daldinia childiae]KAF3063543.1 putative hsp70 family chaperone protein [Daldinia childiae]
MASERPDILVAIDLGTTYTGVAWARPQRNQTLQSPIQIIHNWPGTSTKNEQKVHTCLVYNDDESLSSWGYLCEDDDMIDKKRREFFKIFLDQRTLEDAHRRNVGQVPKSVCDAQRLVSDYLRQVYSHVKSTVELHTGIGHVGWQELVVEFIFSVPTTWRSQEIINSFKKCIKDAGFGIEGRYHTAKVELTESEAAAVGTIKNSPVVFETGDIFLSVDAGGGTTDLALMQVIEARQPFPLLSQLNQVDGIGIGSTLIDQAFVTMINNRLSRFTTLVDQLPPDCAVRLVKSERYRTTKHKFGERVYQSTCYKLPLDGVPYNLNHSGAQIELGKIVVSWEEMQSLFDPHVEGIMKKIYEQLDWMLANGINRPISYMILSGGLGSSKYVRDRIQHEMMTSLYPHAHQVKVLQAPDPQLVVVKGLLLDRLQNLESGLAPVLVSRVARASYGLVCKTKYNPDIHIDEDIKTDSYDGERYAMGQIDWLIRKGDSINTNIPISTTYTKKVDPKDSNRSWDSIVVISDLDPCLLPRSINQEGFKQLCIIKSDITGISHGDMVMRRKSRRFLFHGKKFYLCSYEVRAIVAPAELRFELWFAGQKFSGNHEPIKITWDAEGSKVGG